jgi:cofilin
MASGVTVKDECKQVFEKIKAKKDYRFVVFHIEGEKHIAVESTGGRDEPYDSFLDKLKVIGASGEKECRYGLFDFEYTHQCQGTQEGKKEKLFLMLWCPDDAKVKKKMLYSSSFDALKKALVGVAKYIQATDASEASREAVEDKLRATDRN